MGDRARTVVIVVITVVWALNFIATAVLPGYKAPPEINSIFMGTVGAVLATSPIGRRGEPRRNEEELPAGEDSQSEPRTRRDRRDQGETGDQQ